MIARPSGRERGAADEVHLAADAAVDPVADRVGDDLAGQVDLDRRVDGGHPAERPDDVGVVGEVDRAHLDHRVVVDEVVQPPRAHHERGHDLAAVALLAGAGDDAGLDEVDDGVGEHLGVDPEVAACRAGRAPSPPGSRRSRAGGSRRRGRARRRTRRSAARRRRSAPTACSYGGTSTSTARSMSLDVDEAVAEGPRHRLVELDDDRRRGADRRVHRLDRTSRASRTRGASGGVALTKTASSGSGPDSNSRGTSDRKTGT